MVSKPWSTEHSTSFGLSVVQFVSSSKRLGAQVIAPTLILALEISSSQEYAIHFPFPTLVAVGSASV